MTDPGGTKVGTPQGLTAVDNQLSSTISTTSVALNTIMQTVAGTPPSGSVDYVTILGQLTAQVNNLQAFMAYYLSQKTLGN